MPPWQLTLCRWRVLIMGLGIRAIHQVVQAS